ncbi:hypothetical protein TOT_030000632 [Theileria orientalis strain Shintoku]|uniref:Uncharacterized protein n=1 Tax=Theileria orientalis strain Shintoku TaxID=869250 RepID=J4D9G5_THEOR|nr:hypothetical protein TOT_030000632 [Theileria orientalis strain Shintoku]BAM41370.1 hypothetical protein TOT_030000632 [Theileria orientalis strain Shintoku]|eukprot:XP_009691671.1 hypothetical protein TOT_030000632 [Theileria orientalis strain Shintoku]
MDEKEFLIRFNETLLNINRQLSAMSADLNNINSRFMKLCRYVRTLDEMAVKRNSESAYNISCVNPYINYESDSGEYVTLDDIKGNEESIREISGMYKEKFKPILYGAEDDIFSVGGNYIEATTLEINNMRNSRTINGGIDNIGDNEYHERAEKEEAGMNESSVKNQNRYVSVSLYNFIQLSHFADKATVTCRVEVELNNDLTQIQSLRKLCILSRMKDGAREFGKINELLNIEKMVMCLLRKIKLDFKDDFIDYSDANRFLKEFEDFVELKCATLNGLKDKSRISSEGCVAEVNGSATT